MDGLPDVSVTVSEFVDLVNETFEFAFPSIVITGELANFRISKNRWVYFDLKDDSASVRFFGSVYNLPGPLENGMLLQVRGTPHMHELYGFSVNIQTITAAGEGSIRRAAELLLAKLEKEGLFDPARKRAVLYPPRRIGLITSAQSAAYADFMKILGARWSGIDIDLIDVLVQGESAPEQIVAALARFNALAEPPDVLVLIRGGGSADDLAAFSHEQVARAVAMSRIPTVAAIGHEVDTSLAELIADLRASTPSNAAELLVPDKRTVLAELAQLKHELHAAAVTQLRDTRTGLDDDASRLHDAIDDVLMRRRDELQISRQLLEVLSPHAALKRGYAVVRDEGGTAIADGSTVKNGDKVRIELLRANLLAEVTEVTERETS